MKGNNGQASRRQFSRRFLLICGSIFGVLVVFTLMGVIPLGTTNSSSSSSSRSGGTHHRLRESNHAVTQTAQQFRHALQTQQKGEAQLLREVLAADLQLVDLSVVEEELVRAPPNSYDGVYGQFCKLDWTRRKVDPSAVPMFRDLVAQSDDCQGNQYSLSLKKVADLARYQDQAAAPGAMPKVLNFTAATFHESRCGSTLVANAVAAMDSEKHRSYSEAQPPAAAMTMVFGRGFTKCSEAQAALVLQDVVYLMSRSNDPKEERVFFKFQSATTKYIDVFQLAFPDKPWMFVYRDPTQVIMSYVKDDPLLQGKAMCLRSKTAPTPEIRALAERHNIPDARRMPKEEYCAAHLAAITESAVDALSDVAIPVNYETLPGSLHTTILPKILGRPLTDVEVQNIESISQSYSKGRGSKHREFQGDSEQKSQAASPAIKAAAAKFLQESFDRLASHRPRILE